MATYQSSGIPVVSAVITINGVPVYKGMYKNGSKLYGAGPVELGGEF